jgi:hypothetical protein
LSNVAPTVIYAPNIATLPTRHTYSGEWTNGVRVSKKKSEKILDVGNDKIYKRA